MLSLGHSETHNSYWILTKNRNKKNICKQDEEWDIKLEQ